ncbi:MAG: MBL fold metallo-hydrolase [Endomicrobiales bacterium]
MLRICVLASGSTGNATAIWTDTTGILIDCGRSRRYIEDTLTSIGFDVSLIKGIVITHGHGDHVGSAMISMARAYNAPLYIHEETYDAVRRRCDCQRIEGLEESLVRHHTERPFTVGGLELQPFSTYHDGGFAGKPHGFCVTYRAAAGSVARCGGRQPDLPGMPPPFPPAPGVKNPGKQGGEYRIGFLTDTGKVDDRMLRALSGCNAMVLEANHDPEMVKSSDRHYLNKEWVLSDHGHLSNGDHGRAIARIIECSDGARLLSHVFLAHISQQHNTPQNALAQVQAALDAHRVKGVELIPTYHRRKSIVLRIA